MIQNFLLLFLFFFSVLGTISNANEKTICLNMIVKNESHVIAKCLESVKGIIDYWVIVDTGSDDGTQELIKNCLKEIPGELYERPWKDFAHNRNQALQLAKDKADYLFFIDADERIEFLEPFDKASLTDPGYLLTIRQGTTGIDYQRLLLVDNRFYWNWEGVLHENLTGSEKAEIIKKEGIIVHSHTNGYRSKDPDKYLKDAKILEKALEEDPQIPAMSFILPKAISMFPTILRRLNTIK